MKNCILILTLLIAGCGNRMVTENIGEQISQYQIWLDSLSKADTIFDGKKFDYMFLPYNDDGIYHIIYRDSINGYHVKGILHHLQLTHESCEAILSFSRQGVEFTIVHPYFKITPQQLDKITSEFGKTRHNFFTINRKELGFYLDYTIDKTDTAFLKKSVPFFFKDVDFDGKEELVLRFPNEGQGLSNLYQVWDCGLKHNEPYNDFDDLTIFDANRKEITIRYHGGVSTWTRKYYRLEDREMTLYKLIKSREYFEPYKTVISVYEKIGDEMILVDTLLDDTFCQGLYKMDSLKLRKYL